MNDPQPDANHRAKSADLWEKSVVQAFRDLQWIMCSKRLDTLDINLPIAGLIEAAFGDSFVSAGGRLFLLEIKADKHGKRDEWNEEKLACKSLKEALAIADGSGQSDESSQGIDLSLRGHLFLYWSQTGTLRGARVIPGEIVVSSYLLDLAEALSCSGSKTAIELSAQNALAVTPDGELYVPKEQVRAKRLFDSSAALIRQAHEGNPTVDDLGLTPQEMHTYVKWLLERQDGRDLPINALLTSNDGRVCQHLSHVDDLENLLDSLVSGAAPADYGSDLQRAEPDLEGIRQVVLPNPPRRKRRPGAPPGT